VELHGSAGHHSEAAAGADALADRGVVVQGEGRWVGRLDWRRGGGGGAIGFLRTHRPDEVDGGGWSGSTWEGLARSGRSGRLGRRLDWSGRQRSDDGEIRGDGAALGEVSGCWMMAQIGGDSLPESSIHVPRIRVRGQFPKKFLFLYRLSARVTSCY
jgi:hypothetical protein